MSDIAIRLSGKMSENTQLGLLELSLNAIILNIAKPFTYKLKKGPGGSMS